MKNYLFTAVIAAASVWFMSMTSYAAGTWSSDANGRYYTDEEGVLMENRWFSVDSVPSAPHIRVGTTWYYAGEGGAIYRDGWFVIDGYEYYFNSGGGATRDNVLTLNEQKYYISAETGKQSGGWFSVSTTNATTGVVTENWYYANEDGTLICDGFHTLDGRTYYFNGNGQNFRNRWLTDVDADRRFYFDNNGVLQQNGWFAIYTTNATTGVTTENWYYAEAHGGVLKGGFFELDGFTYYFDANGYNYRKRWYVNNDTQDRYYLDEEGHLQTGWYDIVSVNATTGAESVATYYGGEDGSVWKGNRYLEVDGRTYYFTTNGSISKKRWMVDAGKGRKYLGEDGALMQSEWFSISGTNSKNEDYTWWYYADETGRVLRNGWYTVEGETYYLNSAGVMQTGWVDGSHFYCAENGARVYGWQWLPLRDSWLFSDDEELVDYISQNGEWAWFYFMPDTGRLCYATSGTFKEVTLDGGDYCVDERGIVQLGWIRARGGSPVVRRYKYYAQEDSETARQGQLVTGWYQTVGPDEDCTGDVEWFYFEGSGYPKAAATDTVAIEKIDGKSYLFDSMGNALSGLREVNGEIYYFDEDSLAAATGVVKIDDGLSAGKSTYYFEENGRGYTGNHGGRYYYRGKLQTADAKAKYEAFYLPDLGVRLLDESGRIIRGRTVTDAENNKWVISSSGEINTYGSDQVRDVEEPNAETTD
ncbi:MAG: hypothetical protein LIO81_03810 [Clostridiales bacterium]|nr:hypothetical protein [Clostridiales bacterium]